MRWDDDGREIFLFRALPGRQVCECARLTGGDEG